MILENNFYRLSIDDLTGNISSFSDASGKEYVKRQTPLVKINMLKMGARRELRSGAPERIERNAGSVRIFFSNLGGEAVSCVAEAKFSPEDPLTYWTLSLRNNTGDLLESIDYPGITVFDDLVDDGGTRRLFSPMMEGVEMRSTKLRSLTGPASHKAFPPRGWEGAYPGPCPMQFFAYYDGEDGMYFASHDAGGNYKFVEWCAEDGGIRLLHEMFPQIAYEKEYSYSYPVVLGAFKGNWYDAAGIYRDFVMEAGFLKIPKFKDNDSLPEWIKDSPIVITYPVRGTKDTGDMTPNCFYPFSAGNKYIKQYQEAFDSRILVLLMHWEGTAPWAPPYVWPPFGGVEDFKKFGDLLHADGNLLGLYCSGLGWTQQSGNVASYNKEKEFEEQNLSECMEVGPGGKLELTPICGWPIRRGYDMCPACETVKNIAVGEAAKMAAYSDADYVQFFDQNLGGNTYACYSENHGHPPVPGKWMVEEMGELARSMKSVMSALRPEKKILLGCEAAACEPLVNDLFFNDLRYNINYLFGVPVPAYNFVFHGYLCNFMGNHNISSLLVDLKNDDTFLFYRYAYSFAQGDILTVVLKDQGKINWEWDVAWDENVEPDQQKITDFIRLLSDWRKGYLREALNFGRMEKPLPALTKDYREKLGVQAYGERWKHGDYYRVAEGVVTTRFVTDDGQDVQIFVNYKNEDGEITVPVKQLKLVTGFDGTQRKTVTSDGESVTFVMPPRSVFAAEL